MKGPNIKLDDSNILNMYPLILLNIRALRDCFKAPSPTYSSKEPLSTPAMRISSSKRVIKSCTEDSCIWRVSWDGWGLGEHSL